MDTPLTYSTCRSCGARLVWVLTPAGRRQPLDEHPVADGTGNVLIERDEHGQIRGRVLTGDQMPHDGPAYVPHHRTCPAADEHRRRQDATTPKCNRLDCRQPLAPWLVEHGYVRHVGCMDATPPPRTPPGAPAPPPPVVHEQGGLFDLPGSLA